MPGAGRLFDDLLVAPLHRAVALAQADDVAVVVADHLELDVPRPLEEFLHVDLVVAERRRRFRARHRDRAQQRAFGVHHAHAAAAAAARGLDDHRIADLARHAQVRVDCHRSAGPPEPGTQGTPALVIRLIAETLSPIRRMVSAFGPIQVKPLFSTRSAKSAFSERKP